MVDFLCFMFFVLCSWLNFLGLYFFVEQSTMNKWISGVNFTTSILFFVFKINLEANLI